MSTKNRISAFFLIVFHSVAWSQEESLTPIYVTDLEKYADYQVEPLDESLITDTDYIGKRILSMARHDQSVREHYNALTVEGYHSSDYKKNLQKADDAMGRVDSVNTTELKKIMEYYPWFKKSIFGPDVASKAWLIVQHSEDVDLMHKVLFIMEHLIKDGEARKDQYALLYDRLSLRYQDFGLKQTYGSQFSMVEIRGIGYDIELSPCYSAGKELDLKRQEVNLPPMSDYMQMMNEAYNID